ncbi:MAG: chemotaxis protein CheW [Candidatus Poribacteria bacterium]|nr:chemotaxis protein CheW [Candidatus Poribacteria bacterium]
MQQATQGQETGQQLLQGAGQELQVVGFELGSEKFGVDILTVREIIPVGSITRVPNAPDFVEGIINLRGEVIPVIDLRKRVGIEQSEFQKSTRIIVVELDEQQVGFIVDVVSQVLRIATDTVEPPPEMVMGTGSEYIKGVARVADKLLMFLDLKRVLSQTEQTAVQGVA